MKNRTNKQQNAAFVNNEQTPRPSSKRKILFSSLFVSSSLLLSACGGGGSSSTTSSGTTTSTLLKQETLNVPIKEGETKTVDLIAEGCNNSIAATVTLPNGSTTLPDIYSVDDNLLTINLTNVNIADGPDEVERLTLVCANNYSTASGNLDVIKQDLLSDSPLIAVFDLPNSLTERDTLSGSIRLSDDDIPGEGVLENSYPFVIVDESDNVITNGSMISPANTAEQSERIFTITDIDLNDLSFSEGQYRLISNEINSVIGGEENPAEATVRVTFAFTVTAITDSPTIIQAPELESRTSKSIDVTPGLFEDEDGVQNVTVALYSDAALTNPLQTNINGEFSGLSFSTTYYLATIGEAKNELSETFEFKQSSALEVSTSDSTDSPSTITPPTEASKTTTTINVTPGTFNDADGTRNVTVSLYSDFDLDTFITSDVEGNFTELEPSTAYYLAMTGETFNGQSETWEAQTSAGIEIITADLTDSATTITPPTLDSVTGSSINSTPGSFTDADGTRNITVGLFADAALNTLITTNVNGDFSNLTPGSNYYLATIGEAKYGITGEWEAKQSSAVMVATDAISSPEISLNDQEIVGRISSLFFGTSDNTVELEEPTVSNVDDNATYSMNVSPALPELTINSATGIATYSGNTAPAEYQVTITVTNADTGTASATFTLNVID
ncbi:MAG: hypothetical protein JXK16_05425 [Thiotrichales bacterium]|nr:hypothetical protein [Thiotrichales bacterium]